MNARFLLPLVLLALLGTGQPATMPQTPESILAEIQSLPSPQLDKSRAADQAYLDSYNDTWKKRWARQAELELEFYRRFPNHPQAEFLLARRWSNQLSSGIPPQQVAAEVDQFLNEHPEGPRTADGRSYFWLVRFRLAEKDAEKCLALARDFAAKDPKNEAGADYFLAAADLMKDSKAKDELYRKIILEYPNSSSAILVGGRLRKVSQIGMPFSLGFFDVKTNKWVRMQDFRGKVVIIDFWATWCAPCVAEIPHLQKLYDTYKDQGVAIIGVSLDGPREETSLEAVKEFITKKQIDWPQYYQGDGFDSAFSRSWGIDSIPSIFIIDQSGALYATDVPREQLDDVVAKLISRNKDK